MARARKTPTADDVQPLPDDLRRIAVEVFNERPLAGLAVGVVRDGRFESFAGLGSADGSLGKPVTPETVFRVGSITKTMTALALMQLVEEGRIALDDPVAEHLRAFRVEPPRGSPPPTIRHLLTHTGGFGELRGWADLVRPTIGLAGKVDAPARALAEHYRGGLRAELPAGRKWAYANHAFAALGQLLEDVTGEPYAERIRTHVFEPLGMRNSDVLRSDRVRSRLAVGYALKRGRLRPVKDREILVPPAGSVFSSVEDMARYAAALAGGGANEHGRVVRVETLEAMLEPQAGLEVDGTGMGLAYFLDRIDAHRVAGHDGGWPGFVSSLLVAPDDGVGVVAFTNTSVALTPHDATERLLARLLGVEPEDEPVPASPLLWNELTGVYKPLRGLNTNFRLLPLTLGEVEVAVKDSRLVVRAPSPAGPLRRGLELHPSNAEDPLAFELRVAGVQAPVRFERGPDGRVDRVRAGSSRGGFVELHRRPRATSVALWGKAAAAAAALGAGAAIARRMRR
jgi:CubicO group peptidase (beta-lactamase class C family)